MFTIKNFSRLVLGAAITVACTMLLLSSSRCPCRVARGADQELSLRNATPAVDPVTKKKLDDMEGAAESADDLAEVLRSAAMEDKTIIMTFTNEAWTAPGSLLELFLESFRAGEKTEPLLRHLVVVALDAKAFERCQKMHPLCYSLAVGVNFTAEKTYMSKDYLEMMWNRNRFQTRVLELGYTFLFTDVDIVWFRNPLLRIPVGADITISSDKFDGEDPYDMSKRANGGFLYARSNARTISFFKGWYEARREYKRRHDQYVFDKVKVDLSRQHGVAVHFVDTAYFGGFCEPKMDFRLLCTFHANCLVGLTKKTNHLQGILGEWKQFKDVMQERKNNGTIPE